MDRKYRQSGYYDDDRDREKRPPGEDRGRGAPPKPREIIGPRTPRFPARVTVARCANCGVLLARGFDVNGQCSRCSFELHSCKQCTHFDTAARWECTRPIAARVSPKDARNECTFYEIRMSSERETTSSNAGAAPTNSRLDDPRKAFEDLFKK